MRQFMTAVLLCGLAGAVPAAVLAQSSPFGNLGLSSSGKREAVEYMYPEQLTVTAGKSTPVALHFQIAPGLHINSHAPKEEFLIPTSLSFPANSDVKLEAADYPPGHDYVLPADPKTKLNVYSGRLVINAQLQAQPGDHLVRAKLRYQACDETQCMPPKTITVPIDVIGK